MADPLTGLATLGAVSAILQVIDFSAKVISETKKLLSSSDDALRENIIVERLTLEHSNLANRLITHNNSKRPLNAEEQAVDDLAQECKREAAKLLEQLDALKVESGLRRAKRVWKTTRKTAKALQQRKAIERQQRYLGELHNRLSTALLQILRTTQLSDFEDILDRLHDTESKNATAVLQSKQAILEAMDAHAKQHDAAINQRLSETYSRIDSRLAREVESKKTNLIVDSLRFPEMRLRKDAIPRAHEDTFKWILDESSSPFRTWLSSSEGIFWVSGKAGSGKSTLMKYISSHQETKNHLQTWAGGSRLVIVDSYLWNPGTALQRDEQGLLQQILYQILSTNLDLVRVASPTRWQSDPIYLQRPDPWSRHELREALRNVLEHNGHMTHFCFFIDGLDEYHNEHSRLIATLTELAKHPRIKLCVSSRPWNVFRNAFKDLESTLRLEELTYDDICLYVDGELKIFLEGETLIQTLVTQIVAKAQGVFLWVFLVVRSLREGIEEGDSPSLLFQRVDEFPSDLEDYFRLILSRVSKTYRKQTSQALKLATLCLSDRTLHKVIWGPSSFVTFWLLSQGLLENPRFAVDLDIQCFSTNEQPLRMYEDTRTFLSACCKDFLCLRPLRAGFDNSFKYGRVEFLHRTVFDFLENEDMKQLIDGNIPAHFKHRLLLSRLALAHIKLMPNEERPCQRSTETMLDGLLGIEYDDQALELVAEYEKTAVRHLDSFCPTDCEVHKHLDRYLSSIQFIVDCFASYQLHSYIEKLVFSDPSFLQAAMEVEMWSLLGPALGTSSIHQFPISKIDLSFLRFLLQHGAGNARTKGYVWREFLIKAVTERPSWSDLDKEHAAKVVQMLVSFRPDMQSSVNLPFGLRLPEHDDSDEAYLPLEILTAIFSEQQMEAIRDAMKLLLEE